MSTQHHPVDAREVAPLDIQDVSGQLDKTRQKLSSGKELTRRPTTRTRPASASCSTTSRSAQQHQETVDEAQSWQNVTDTALGEIGDIVLRVRDLAVQGANGALGPQRRATIAHEVNQLIHSIKSAANAQYAGRYVFAGSATLTQPYQLGANDAYSGNAEVVKREIGPGVQIDLNTVGQSTFGDDTIGLMKTLRDIVTDLNSGTPPRSGTPTFGDRRRPRHRDQRPRRSSARRATGSTPP